MMKNKSIICVVLIIITMLPVFPQQSIEVNASTNGQRIVVSLGDSYSSGEGVEDFYGQNLSEKERAKYVDFLAHRSQESWPGKLVLNGQVLSRQKDVNINWYFVASSGAETKHFNGKANKKHTRMIGQKKTYCRNGINETTYLDSQLTIFKTLENQGISADYVTMTIGGNDVGFGDVITKAVIEGNPYLCPVLLADQLNLAWYKFYFEGIKDNIRQAYIDVRNAAGEETNIIVAGYPRLVADVPVPNNSFTVDEALLINSSVSRFNDELNGIISELNKKDKNIYFVSVEDEFRGHEAYSISKPYINSIMPTQKYDLSEFDLKHPLKTVASNFSDYSMHPNKDGTDAYARCVQEIINELENKNRSDNQDEDVGDWRHVYIDYLKKYMNEVDNPESCGFSLVCIDDNDTPELVIRDGNSHYSGASVYTYMNSKVVPLVEDLGGTYGIIGYVERKGLIYCDVMYQGRGTTTIYKIEAGTCKKLISLYSDGAATPEGMTPNFQINDKSVSEEEYHAAWAEYENNNISYTSYDDMALSLNDIESINNY